MFVIVVTVGVTRQGPTYFRIVDCLTLDELSWEVWEEREKEREREVEVERGKQDFIQLH